MIADTTFISHLLREYRRGEMGPARTFFANHRRESIRTTIITAGELAVLFSASWQAWEWLARWRILPLHPGIAAAAADIDRAQRQAGKRLGENDNWIAGFASFYRQPIISRDSDFDAVSEVRRITY